MRERDDSSLVYSSEGEGMAASRRGSRPDARAGTGSDVRRHADHTPNDGVVRIWLERQGRNGKPVSIVRGLRLDSNALVALATRLKRACGTGDTAKDGEILIQGNHRERIAAELGKDGLRVKLAGG